METMDPALSPLDKLVYMNQELFMMIENTVSVSLLSQLFASQLVTKGERHLLEPSRTYYKLLRQITIEGQQKVMYDWCLCNGNYSLCQYSSMMLPPFLKGFCK